MLLGNVLHFDEYTEFKSLSKDPMRFDEVYQEILNFIRADADSSYRISLGTDSQVGPYTVFVTCIHVHRIGKGAIGFLHRSEIPRQIKSIREKIYLETCATLQLAYMFEGERVKIIRSLVKNRGVDFEFHIDVGTKGETKALINEMVGLVKGLDFIPRIKPDSYCASSFADRFTKAM